MTTRAVPNFVFIIFTALVALTLGTGCPTCPTPEEPEPAPSVKLQASATSLDPGNTVTIQAVSTDGDDAEFTWCVSNPSVGSLSDEKLEAGDAVTLTAVGGGTAIVMATGSHSGLAGAIEFTVSGPPISSHAGRYTTYEGAKTCAPCHPGKANEVHASVHYQWNGSTPDIVGLDNGGKMTGMNDFCTAPGINFIGLLTNLQGQQVSGGCAQCHVGMGAKPLPDATQAQLDNVDCLMCHARDYRRKVVSENGVFKFTLDEAAMPVPLLQAITAIEPRPNDTCIKCHAFAGGGQNNKRGDIEAAHFNPSHDFDVHMASIEEGGAGLLCIDCHVFNEHKVSGRGTDLQVTESQTALRCTSCHDEKPHENSQLNRHTDRVECTVCHIPAFSRGSSTEMYRDFSVQEINTEKQLYEPELTRQQNVVPEYRFFDGESHVYSVGQVADVDPDTGYFSMARPAADINSRNAKLNAFKVHYAYQPIDPVTNKFIPLKMGIYFQTTNIAGAITTGASQSGLTLTQGYEYVEAQRYMGIFHEVAPANQALACTDCHGPASRVNFEQLGYTPKTEYLGEPLCAVCHEDRSDDWEESEYFFEVHEEHVTENDMDCRFCHTWK